MLKMYKMYYIIFCLGIFLQSAVSDQLCRVGLLKRLGNLVGFGPYKKFMAQHNKQGDILSFASGEIMLDNGKSYQCNKNGNWNKIPGLKGRHYRLVLQPETGPVAYRKCGEQGGGGGGGGGGGKVATVYNMRVNDVMTMAMRQGAVLSALIGYSDAGKEGDWQWDTRTQDTPTPEYGGSSGSVAARPGYDNDFANWRKGQPNNAGAGEDYAVITTLAEGQWFDVGPPKQASFLATPKTSTKFPYWCEIEVLNDFKRNVRLRERSDTAPFNGRNEGHLQVEIEEGVWGGVCHTTFNSKSAMVVCRSLGFPLGGDYTTSRLGKSLGEIVIGDVECEGDEASIFDCPHRDIAARECTDKQQVWVICFETCPKDRYIAEDGTCAPCQSNTANNSNTSNNTQCVVEPDTERACGVRRIITAAGRIVGGAKAAPGEYPWQIALKRGGVVICGGTIIDHSTVITAGHCVQRYKNSFCYNADSYTEFLQVMKTDNIKLDKHWEPNTATRCSWAEIANFEVEAGVIDYVDPLDPISPSRNQTHRVDKIYVSKKYVYVYGNIHNDIAILKLSTPFQYTDYVQPACLPDKNTEMEPGDPLVITGFGALQGNARTANILYEAHVSLISRYLCNVAMNKRVSKNMFCAGEYDGGIDACSGDSGGPLGREVGTEHNTRYYQMGVISWGIGCARARLYGVYTDIRRFIDFVEDARDEKDYLYPVSAAGLLPVGDTDS